MLEKQTFYTQTWPKNIVEAKTFMYKTSTTTTSFNRTFCRSVVLLPWGL